MKHVAIWISFGGLLVATSAMVVLRNRLRSPAAVGTPVAVVVTSRERKWVEMEIVIPQCGYVGSIGLRSHGNVIQFDCWEPKP